MNLVNAAGKNQLEMLKYWLLTPRNAGENKPQPAQWSGSEDSRKLVCHLLLLRNLP